MSSDTETKAQNTNEPSQFIRDRFFETYTSLKKAGATRSEATRMILCFAWSPNREQINKLLDDTPDARLVSCINTKHEVTPSILQPSITPVMWCQTCDHTYIVTVTKYLR